MFEPITITDSCGDETEVYLNTNGNDPRVMIKVADEALLDYLDECADDSQAVARGSYDLGQAKALVAALQSAIAAIETQEV